MIERPEEVVARVVMSAALGVPVEQHDDGSAPAMFDFQFTLAEGRLGAAEMTTLAEPDALQWDHFASKSHHLEGSSWVWFVRPNRNKIVVKDLMRHMPAIAAAAEGSGTKDVAMLLYSHQKTEPAFKWLAASGASITGSPSDNGGRVFVMHDAVAAFVHDSLDPMVEYLDHELAGERFDGEFAKLSGSRRPEQHLVLRVHPTGMPPEHWIPMSDARVLPSRTPSPAGRFLTGLWLLPQFGHAAIVWTADRGWFILRRDEVPGMT